MINGVIAKNFQSWENLKFQLSDGVTLIDGWNHDDQTAEGSGKSAILNAVCWGLFGKLPKESKIDDVIKAGQKSAEVKILLNHPIILEIVRTRKPNELSLIDVNNKVIKGKDAKETQKMIEEFVGLSFDTFCQTIYFPQNYPKKFVTATQEERGKILSEIQDLNIFDKARKEVMDLIKLENKKQVDLNHQIETNTIKFQSNQRAIEQQKQFYQQKIAEQNQRISRYNTEITNKQTQANEVAHTINQFEQRQQDLQSQSSSWESDLQQINSEIDSLQQQIASERNLINDKTTRDIQRNQIKNDISRYDFQKTQLNKKKTELEEFIKNPSEICPTCGTNLGEGDTSHASEEVAKLLTEMGSLDKHINELNNNLSDMCSEIDTTAITNKINEMSNVVNQLKQAEQAIKTNQVTLQNIESQISTYANMYQLHMNEIEKYTNLITEETNNVIEIDQSIVEELSKENTNIESNLNSLNELLNTSKIYLSRLEVLKVSYKEVKSYTFNSVLNELTYKANNYLTQLFETPVELKFTNDNMKIELDLNINSYTRGYGLFSGGQQRRIGLAVDLALSEIIAARSGSKCVNLRFLDEYFKDLDENSMQKCLHLLEKLGGSTILIEHNSIFKSIVDNTFNVELRNETSRVVV